MTDSRENAAPPHRDQRLGQILHVVIISPPNRHCETAARAVIRWGRSCQYIICDFQKQANKARNLMSERRRRGPSSAQTPPFEKLKGAKVERRRRASNTHKHFFLKTTQLRERELFFFFFPQRLTPNPYGKPVGEEAARPRRGRRLLELRARPYGVGTAASRTGVQGSACSVGMGHALARADARSEVDT